MARLVAAADLGAGRSKSEVARDCGLSWPWVHFLVQRFLAEESDACAVPSGGLCSGAYLSDKLGRHTRATSWTGHRTEPQVSAPHDTCWTIRTGLWSWMLEVRALAPEPGLGAVTR
jgi:hypothetical protein